MSRLEEKQRKIYYQNIAYSVCNFIDAYIKGKTTVGTVEHPCDNNVIKRLKQLIKDTTKSKTENTANGQQVDGNHYQTEIQPWDFIEANKLTFIEGNIVKYVTRHRKKNGVRDLMKAKHYLEKLIEIEQSKPLGDSDVTGN